MLSKPVRPLRRNAVPLPPHVWLHPRLYLAFNSKFFLPLWTLETGSLRLFMQISTAVGHLHQPTDWRIILRASLKVGEQKRSFRKPFSVLKSESDRQKPLKNSLKMANVFPSKTAVKWKSGTSPLDSSNIPSEPELESRFQFNLLANPDAESWVRPF